MNDNDTSRTLRFEPGRVVRALAAVAALLVLVHLGFLLLKALTGHDRVYGLVRLFDLDKEHNIPSFFSGCLFLLNALLLALVARTVPRSAAKTTWKILAGLFVYLAFDELFAIHERLTKPVREAFHTSGPFYYAWILVYLPIVAVIAGLFAPVWRRLDGPVRSRLAVAAGTYLAGAVGVEIAGGMYREAVGPQLGLGYGVLVAIEESLEMAGLIILARALFDQLERTSGGGIIVAPDGN